MREAERILREWGGIRFPLDKIWKQAAVVFVAEREERVREVVALGLDAITDPERRRMVAEKLGPQNGTAREDYNFTAFLLDECIGPTIMSPRYIFMRCLSCHRIRTGAGMARGTCKCGGGRMAPDVEPLSTQRILKLLATGC